jgi:hypothetical protein
MLHIVINHNGPLVIVWAFKMERLILEPHVLVATVQTFVQDGMLELEKVQAR